MFSELKIDAKTRVYGILGDPVDHSLSPAIHNAAFKKLGLNAVYVAFRVSRETLGLAFEGVRSLGIHGLNITIPLKEDVLGLVDDIPEDLDRLTGAINTVVLKNGELLGYNTDGPGLLFALQNELSFKPEGRDILVLGAGGAARAAVFSLARAHADRIFIFNRTRERAQGLAEYASEHFPETTIEALSSPEDLPEKKMDLILNTTACGMKGNKELPLDWALVREPKAAYDLVYTSALTPWLSEAKKRGIPHANGLGMLAAQAAISFELWTGKKDGVRDLMLETLRECRLS